MSPDPSTRGPTSAGNRSVLEVVRRTTGLDLGECESTRLDDLGLSGVQRLMIVHALENALETELPEDLMAAIETVGDVVHSVRAANPPKT